MTVLGRWLWRVRRPPMSTLEPFAMVATGGYRELGLNKWFTTIV
jgi:hypothetical protein